MIIYITVDEIWKQALHLGESRAASPRRHAFPRGLLARSQAAVDAPLTLPDIFLYRMSQITKILYVKLDRNYSVLSLVESLLNNVVSKLNFGL